MRALPELAAELSAMVPAPVYIEQAIPAMAYHRLTGRRWTRRPTACGPSGSDGSCTTCT